MYQHRRQPPGGLHQQLGGGVYQNVMNRMFKRGERLKDGEVHPPVQTPDGWAIPSYLGPGSDFLGKFKAGIQPVNEVDMIAKIHDARYQRARNADDVRIADERMIKKLNEVAKEGKDTRYNIALAKYPIKAKVWLENKGIAGENTFTTPGGDIDPEDAKLVDEFIERKTQEGYGRKKRKRSQKGDGRSKATGRYTKDSKWIKHVRAYAKQHNVPYKVAMKQARASYKK